MPAHLRLATEQDSEEIAGIYRPVVESTAISFETEPPTVDEVRARIDKTLIAYPWLVCELKGRVVGYAYASAHRVRLAYQWSVDTSVYVHGDSRRAGVGRALYVSLLRILAAQGYFNAYAGIALPNPGSVALHEAVGFSPIGVYRKVGYKLGAWHDVGWWHAALHSSFVAPTPPLKLADVRNDAAWTQLLAAGEQWIRNAGEAI